LKGTGFSPYIQSTENNGALRLAENFDQEGFVKGHDFSRADKDNRMDVPSAPEVRLSLDITTFLTFFRNLFSP
jgi:hypothetical protein